MQSSFEIKSLPDLSLPRYYDLFGEEALGVAGTRLFTWLQIAMSIRQRLSFTLRYIYDPIQHPSNRRLRIYVIISTPEDAPASLFMGEKLVGEVLDLETVAPERSMPPNIDLENFAILERKERLVLDKAGALYLPSVWTRQAAARNALEPYLDEAFAALSAPAFLDIQLHSCETGPVRQALRSILDQLERRKHGGSTGSEDNSLHFQALAAALSEDPVCRLLIMAGSRVASAADGMLRAFGMDAIGGSRFKVAAVDSRNPLHSLFKNAVETGMHDFIDEEGWFSRSLRAGVQDKPGQLTSQQENILKELSELSVLAGAELIRDVLTLPIPRRGFLRTFPLETEQARHMKPITFDPKEGVLRLGASLERHEAIELPVADLTRHAFVAGVTGSGKTVTVFNVLRQLAEQNIPFLVFEPAKAEYRALSGFSALSNKLRIYTPGRDDLSPLRFNPFAFDAHISLSSHIAGLAAAFNCALGLFAPVNTILEEALWELYESKGWLEDDRGALDKVLPRVDEVPDCTCRIIDSLGYNAEITGQFKGVIRSRFIRLSRGSVGRVFDCDRSFPAIAEMCKAHSVVELRTLTQQEANLVTMFLLMAIREHLADSAAEGDRPRLVMVLEEAHNLVPAVSDEQAGGEEINAKTEASRYVSNMLAEMRALGLSIVVVDQTPAAVAPQVVRNTNLKIAHRTVSKQDRDTLADAMLMHPAHSELLGRLVAGQAYVYADHFYRPHLMQGAFAAADLAKMGRTKKVTKGPPSDVELLSWLQSSEWFKEATRNRISAIRDKVSSVAQSLVALSDQINLEYEDYSSDPVDHEQSVFKRKQLRLSWNEKSKRFARVLNSIEAEHRAAITVARNMHIRVTAATEIRELRKMEILLSQTISMLTAELSKD